MAVIQSVLSPQWRVSFFFRQQADLSSGWSENFWNTLGDYDAVLAAALRLKNALETFKGEGTECHAIRISDLNGFREVGIKRFDQGILPGTNPDNWSDIPNSAVLMKLKGTGKTLVNQWQRGICDAVIKSFTGKLKFRAGDQRDFNAIAALLTNGREGWQVRLRDPGQELKDIVNITAQGLVTVRAHGYLEGNRVRISRAHGLTYANRVWKITAPEADTFQLVGWFPPTEVVPPYEGNGVVRRLTYVYQQIQAVTADRATTHRTGRPFGLASGRRKIRKH